MKALTVWQPWASLAMSKQPTIILTVASCVAMVAFLAGCAAANRVIGCVASAVPAITCQGGEPGR